MLLAVLVCFAACRPRGILSSHKMRNVLYDLHRAEAIIQVSGYNYGHDEDVARYYQVVLDKNHVTKAEFDSSLVWYTDHPQLFNRIYPKIMQRCQKEKEYWEKLAEQTHKSKVQKRDLPPLEHVIQTLQKGYEIQLVPDSILAAPEEVELLLPIGRNDSILVSHSLTPNLTETQNSTVSTAPDTSEDIIDGKTPAERRREEQLNRLHERLKLNVATEK